jgi:hypothetical protein
METKTKVIIAIVIALCIIVAVVVIVLVYESQQSGIPLISNPQKYMGCYEFVDIPPAYNWPNATEMGSQLNSGTMSLADIKAMIALNHPTAKYIAVTAQYYAAGSPTGIYVLWGTDLPAATNQVAAPAGVARCSMTQTSLGTAAGSAQDYIMGCKTDSSNLTNCSPSNLPAVGGGTTAGTGASQTITWSIYAL